MSKARDVSRLFSKTGSSSGDVGSSTVFSDTPPAGAGGGDKWFNTTNLTTYMYYDDGTSLQWVPASAPVPGPTGATGATGSAATVNFSAINQAMIPDTDVTYDLGSSTHKWKDLYLSGSTLHLGASATISAGTGSEIVLPSIKIGAGANAVKLSANASGGLETQAVVGGTTQAVKPAGGTVQVADLAAMQAIANPSIGDMVSVVSNKTIYMYNGTGFYKIAVMVNESPTAITGVSDTYELATDGTATTITAISSDPEGRALTWSYAVSSGSLTNGGGATATVTQGTGSNSHIFTITPTTNSSYQGSFSITFNVTDNVNGAVSKVSAFTLSFVVTNSRYTALSVKATATGSNQTFDDASASNHTITVAGDTTTSTFSPYRHGGYSAYFDGSGDRLDITSALSISGDFTIEGWFMRTPGSVGYIWDMQTPRASLLVNSSGEFRLYASGNSAKDPVGNCALNEWVHFALVRQGSGTNNCVFYQNGSSIQTFTDTGLYNTSGAFALGGRYAEYNATFYISGYLRDFRIVETAVYTSNFTSPTEPLTAITNTKFLLGNLPYFKDQSTSNHAITVVGNASLEPKSVFDNGEYSEADHGASVYFDGTGDGIQFNGESDFAFGTNDFTVEFWLYPGTRTASEVILFDTRGSSGNGTYTNLLLDSQYSTNNIKYHHQGGTRITSSAIPDNAWTHVALVRQGYYVRLFINGKQEGSTFTNSLSQLVGTNGPSIGSYYDGNWAFKGYMSDIRVLNGTCAYFSNFTPATSPLTTTPPVFNINVTNSGSNAYTLTSDTLSTDMSSSNPTVNMAVGQTVNFVVNASGHPFHIRVSDGGADVSTPAATGQGTQSGTVTWTPNTAGTYYYQCSNHSAMIGTINVTESAKLLLNPETSISDLSQRNALICRGDVETSTTQVKFAGTKSIYFSGSDDYIHVPNSGANSAFSLNSTKFTIEGWFYKESNAGPNWDQIISKSRWANNLGWGFKHLNDGTFTFEYSTNGTSSSSLTSTGTLGTGAWAHVALVANNNLKLYINGVGEVLSASALPAFFDTTYDVLIGATRNDNTDNNDGAKIKEYRGWMQDLRIHNNHAQYTANFTPPTTELQG